MLVVFTSNLPIKCIILSIVKSRSEHGKVNLCIPKANSSAPPVPFRCTPLPSVPVRYCICFGFPILPE